MDKKATMLYLEQSLVEQIDFVRRKPQVAQTRTKFISDAAKEKVEQLNKKYLEVWANGLPRSEVKEPSPEQNSLS